VKTQFLVGRVPDLANQAFDETFEPWKPNGSCYSDAVSSDENIRKQVGRPRAERPLVRLARLNQGLHNLGVTATHESRTDHIRKLVVRAGRRTG